MSIKHSSFVEYVNRTNRRRGLLAFSEKAMASRGRLSFLLACLFLLLILSWVPTSAWADNPPTNLDRIHPGASPADLGMVRSARSVCPQGKTNLFGSLQINHQDQPFSFDLFKQNGIDKETLSVVERRTAISPSFGIALGQLGLETAVRIGLVFQSGQGNERLEFDAPPDLSLGDIEWNTKYSFLKTAPFSMALGADLATGIAADSAAMVSDGPFSARVHVLMEPAVPKAGANQRWVRFPLQVSYNYKTEEEHPALDRLSDLSMGGGAEITLFNFAEDSLVSFRTESMMLLPASGDAFEPEGSSHRAWYAGVGLAFHERSDFGGWSGAITGATSPNFASGEASREIEQLSGRGNFFGPYGSPPMLMNGVVSYTSCCLMPQITGVDTQVGVGVPEGGGVITGKNFDGGNVTLSGQDATGIWHPLTVVDSGPERLAFQLPEEDINWSADEDSSPHSSSSLGLRIPVRVTTGCGDDIADAVLENSSPLGIENTCPGWHMTFSSVPRCAADRMLKVTFYRAGSDAMVGETTVPFAARVHVDAPFYLDGPVHAEMKIDNCLAITARDLPLPTCNVVRNAVAEADLASKHLSSVCKTPKLSTYRTKHADCAGLPNPLVKSDCKKTDLFIKEEGGIGGCANAPKQVVLPTNGEYGPLHHCIYLRRCQICPSARIEKWSETLVAKLKDLPPEVRKRVTVELRGHSSRRWQDEERGQQAIQSNMCLSRIRLEAGAQPLSEGLREMGIEVIEVAAGIEQSVSSTMEESELHAQDRRIEVIIRIKPNEKGSVEIEGESP